MKLSWGAAEEPLVASAVLAQDAAAQKLVIVLLRRDDPTLARLRAVTFRDGLLVIGVVDDLPWCDGAVYLGRHAEAPALLLPTAQCPCVEGVRLPWALLERAVLSRLAGSGPADPPIAVVPGASSFVPAGAASVVRRSALEAWKP